MQRTTTSHGGTVAAGHTETARAASEVLRAGGNAFDAAVTAMFCACVAEPILASLGGGGFMTARPWDDAPLVYDFFTQTPIHKQPSEAIDFSPILADFGTARQTFHIGLGAIATPGMVRGIFQIHRELCTMPLPSLIQPAIRLANQGVRVNPFQHLIAEIVSPILFASEQALALHASPVDPHRLIQEGELHRQPELADFLDCLGREGEGLFYAGEAGQHLIADCRRQGGQLRQADLDDYRVIRRQPLSQAYRNARLLTNPLPSLGGTLVTFGLSLLESQPLPEMPLGGERHLRTLCRAMCLTQQLRNQQSGDLGRLLDPQLRQAYCRILAEGGVCRRGTTQISIADRQGNLASVTLSNGEGAGYVIPGTGIMPNNMLGEEDLNPRGFQRWPENRRLASMMAPSLLLFDDGRVVVTGSGGSNRIRSVILQVISNLVDFGLPLQQAIEQPRLHFEGDLLSLEPLHSPRVASLLEDEFPHQQRWERPSLFFGGAHTVMIDSDQGLQGAGDPRRGGVARVC